MNFRGCLLNRWVYISKLNECLVAFIASFTMAVDGETEIKDSKDWS